MKEDRNCKNCGKPFTAVRPNHFFDTTACYHAYGRLGGDRQSDVPPDHVAGAAWIPLGRGRFVLIDEADLPRAHGRNWFYMSVGYAGCHVRENGKKTVKYLHRLLLGEPEGEVDHINLNKLDCRRSNLRVVQRDGNTANRMNASPVSGFRGVYRAPESSRKRWLAKMGGTPLGTFVSSEDAARAYDEAARRRFGPLARLNYPGEGEQPTLLSTPTVDDCVRPSRRKRPPSGFYGVYRASGGKPWKSQILVGRVLMYLGRFSSPEEAARAYDAASWKARGKLALLNFPSEYEP